MRMKLFITSAAQQNDLINKRPSQINREDSEALNLPGRGIKIIANKPP